MTTEVCNYCGGAIVFRHRGGALGIIHIDGTHCEGSGRTNFTPQLVSSTESECRPTNCPRCGDEVFFIRHNGGSVWIEPPLGSPWEKHGCMYDGDTLVRRSLGPLIGKKRRADFGGTDETYLAVVKFVEASANQKATLAKTIIPSGDSILILLKGDARRLVGELIIVDEGRSEVRSVADEIKAWKVVGPTSLDGSEAINSTSLVCPACMAHISVSGIRQHFTQLHKFTIFGKMS